MNAILDPCDAPEFGFYDLLPGGSETSRPVAEFLHQVDRTWRLVAISPGPGCWRWTLPYFEQVMLQKAVEGGHASTVQERRSDGTIWLLAAAKAQLVTP